MRFMAPRHLFLMLIICLVWGFTFVAGKAGVSEMPPMLFTGLRYALLAVLLVPFLEIVEGKMPQVLAISVTMGSVHFALFYGGLSVASNVSAIAVAVQLSVPISTIMSIVFLNEQVGWRRWLGIVMSFGGVVVISFDPAIINERLGLLMVIGAAFLGSVGMIIMKQIQDTGIYQMQAWIAMMSWPPLFAASLVFESGHLVALTQSSWMAWGGVIYTAVGASLIGHAGMYYLLQRYDVSVTAPLTLMAPIFGIMSGVIFWGDTLGVRFWIGGTVALLGVLIIGLRKREVAPAGATL